MKLADEIRAITIPHRSMRLESEAVWALRKAIELVDKREAERAERIKTFSNEYDAIRWGHDGDCGANEVVSRFLESEDVYNAEVAAGLAEATQANYERAAAEMHEDLVELLSSIPCIKCGISTECGMSTKLGAIYDAIERAKAL